MPRYQPVVVEIGLTGQELIKLSDLSFISSDFDRSYFFSCCRPSDRDIISRAGLSIYRDFSRACMAPDNEVYERYASRALRKIKLFYDESFIGNDHVLSLAQRVGKLKMFGERTFGYISQDLNADFQTYLKLQQSARIVSEAQERNDEICSERDAEEGVF